jgi:tetratricopeptide (TPR) repeat protein
MTEIIVGILGAAGLVVIYKIIRAGGKEFQPKLSHHERAILEKSISDENEIKVKAVSKEKAPLPSITNYPTKNLKEEINRFRTFFDVESEKLTKAIRKGIEKFGSSDFKGAVGEFSAAIDLKPSEPVAHYCRAITKLRQRNYESSIQDFTEAIRLQMGEVNCLYYRATAKYYSKDYGGAVLDFTSYLKAVPEFPEAYFMLGLVFKDSAKLVEAIENFSTAIIKNPRHESAYFERALVKHKTGDKEGCCKDLKEAYGLGHLESYHYIKELCEQAN